MIQLLKLQSKIIFHLGYENISRDELYYFDEAFLTGTASEIVPVGIIDHRVIGDGGIGPITKKIQQNFENIVRGNNPDKRNWLTIIK